MGATRGNFVFFTVLFLACLIGSIAIFVFAVGVETGNPIIRNVMNVLLRNALWVVAGVVVFNALVWGIYEMGRKNKMKRNA